MNPRPITSSFVPYDVSHINDIRDRRDTALNEFEMSRLARGRRKEIPGQLLLFSKGTRRAKSSKSSKSGGAG